MATSSLIFETARLRVRPYTPEDLDLFFRLNGDEQVMRYIRPAQTYEQTREFLQKIITDYAFQPGRGRWAVEMKTGEFVGSFAIIPVEHEEFWQLGYALLPAYWGQGLATESVRGGLRYAFDVLKMERIAAITFPENRNSQKVLLNNGFVFDSLIPEDGRQLHLYFRRPEFSAQEPV